MRTHVVERRILTVQLRDTHHALADLELPRFALGVIQRLTDRVRRPDLLLVGALFHDIGKGQPGDHSEAGVHLVEKICPRMGFPPDDVEIIRALVRHHLLLADTATPYDRLLSHYLMKRSRP